MTGVPAVPDPSVTPLDYEKAANLHERNATKISRRNPQGPTDGFVAGQERDQARAARTLGKAAKQERKR